MPSLAADIVTYAARIVRQARREFDVPASTRVLSLLDELGPSGISQLAAADSCAQPTMSAQIRQMEADGLVRRMPNPADARATLISLSVTGAETLAALRTQLGAAAEAKLADRSSQELALVLDVLRALAEPTPARTRD